MESISNFRFIQDLPLRQFCLYLAVIEGQRFERPSTAETVAAAEWFLRFCQDTLKDATANG